MSEQTVGQDQGQDDQGEEMVDGCAILEADAAAAQRSISKAVAGFQSQETKMLGVRLSGDVLEFIKDLAKLTARIRDDLFDAVTEHDERLAALEGEEPMGAVMDKADADFFLQVAGELKGLALALLDIKEYSRHPHNASEYETKIKGIDEEVLQAAIKRSDEAVLKITELSMTEEEEEEGEDVVDTEGTTSPGGEG